MSVPKGLSRKGRSAALAMVRVLAENGHTTEERSFYTPREWRERGETSGEGAALIVVHDGGDLYNYLSYMSEVPAWQEKLREALVKVGVYAESINNWSTAIYEL